MAVWISCSTMQNAETLEDLDRRITNLELEWAGFHVEPPELLYHYTDVVGLVGITEGKKLWATDATFLHDPLELEALGKTVGSPTNPYSGPLTSCDQYLRDGQVDPALDAESAWKLGGGAFVASFSTKCDSLSQWRAYGRSAMGYCLGFAWFHDKREAGIRLRKCSYGEVEMNEYFKSQEAVRELCCRAKNQQYPGADERLARIDRLRADCSTCVKHDSYRGESEWRILADGAGHEIFHRGVRDIPVPYIKIQVSSDAKPSAIQLRSVLLGPALNSSLAWKATERLLRVSGFPNVTIESSRVPYRA